MTAHPTPDITVRSVRRADVPAVIALVRDTLAEFGLTFGAGSATDEQLLRHEANGFVRDDAQVRGARCTRGYARVL